MLALAFALVLSPPLSLLNFKFTTAGKVLSATGG